MIPGLTPQYSLSPLQRVELPVLQQRIELFIKRDDLIHPQVSGNKWRKLKYNLLQARQEGVSRLMTFGGGYSNHLHAFAAACRAAGIEGVAIVRGERPTNLGSTLQFVDDCGVHLHFVSREEYRQRNGAEYVQRLQRQFAPCEWIPEGGSNALALRGVAEIIPELRQQMVDGFDVIATPIGSGGTLAGLLTELQPDQRALGVCVLKGAEYLQQQVEQLAPGMAERWQINHDYHFGGYAKFNDTLLTFMRDFRYQTGVALEPIYTAKLMYGLVDLVSKNYFPSGCRVVALHTGGMQGLDGMMQRFPAIRDKI
ncbi:MAG: pyridoxal-phosphate dependent enzyme [Gammaproteobacteria bacterium]|nr:pyridoxal-phosphate dependent enzyme [Gammaproteobacteria bacterium]